MTQDNGDPEIVFIGAGSREYLYTVSEIPSDLGGRGFLIRRLAGGETYQVLVDSNPKKCQCTCLAFFRWGRCRHLFKIIEMVAKERDRCN